MPILIEDLWRFKRKIFIETGFSIGSGVKRALGAGFQTIYSTEIVKEKYELGLNKFRGMPVNLFLGDSKVTFAKVMKLIKEPATIWLDSHNPRTTSLIEELETLIKHPIKKHIILIDDIRKVKKGDWEGVTLDRIKKMIKQINPKYRIFFIDGHISQKPFVFKDDILVAKL